MSRTLYRLALMHNYDIVSVIQYSFNKEELEDIASILNLQDEGRSGWSYEVDEVWTRK